ncbi:MAG: hypothetical protein ABIJ16_14150 [Bacteroidota bacterium]
METDENINNNLKDIHPGNKSNAIFIVVIVILVLMLGVVGYLYINQLNKTDVVIAELNDTSSEKEKINNDLNALYMQYETLKTDNEELNEKLQEEQDKIIQLLDELKQVKSSNSYQIAQYKKELSTLREIMKSYIVQIDSLNTKNELLKDENTKVKEAYNQVVTHSEKLTQKNEELSEKVDIASVIKAINIVATPINKKSKPVSKTNKVEKVKVCFTLSENEIVSAGNRTVYIRIARPDELVIASSESNIFSFEGNNIIFTERRDVDYQNKPVDLCIYWKKDQELIEGTYYVDIFTDGKLIGETTFILN